MHQTMNEKKNIECPVCGSKIVGRRDKKFCDVQCRVTYHQRMNNDCDKMIRKLNNRLKKNRRILDQFNELGKTICSTKQLLFLGFDFSIHTSIYKNKEGDTFYYCYDRGYVSKGRDKYSLVKRETEEWE